MQDQQGAKCRCVHLQAAFKVLWLSFMQQDDTGDQLAAAEPDRMLSPCCWPFPQPYANTVHSTYCVKPSCSLPDR